MLKALLKTGIAWGNTQPYDVYKLLEMSLRMGHMDMCEIMLEAGIIVTKISAITMEKFKAAAEQGKCKQPFLAFIKKFEKAEIQGEREISKPKTFLKKNTTRPSSARVGSSRESSVMERSAKAREVQDVECQGEECRGKGYADEECYV